MQSILRYEEVRESKSTKINVGGGQNVGDILYIVMPAYNEETNIEKVVAEWYSILDGKNENCRLVVADSGSTDQTHKLLMSMQKDYPQLEILANSDKRHGPKVIALYDYAARHAADYIFQTDSDGQTSPEEFEEFWKLREKYDGIFGNRSVRGDGIIRAFVEKVVCFILRIYFGVKIPDANAPFRLMKADIVKKYLYKLPHDFNLPNIMMTTYFVYYKEKITFKEISFAARKSGINSINIRKIVKIGSKALFDFRKLSKSMEVEDNA